MAVALAVIDVSPASNPDKITFLATLSGTYGVNGAGDPLNLAPYASGSNLGGFTNPKQLALPELPFGYEQAPAVKTENLGGSYVQPSPAAESPAAAAVEGVAPVIAPINGFGLRVFEPGGGEKATNAAYTAAELAGSVVLEVQLPKNQ